MIPYISIDIERQISGPSINPGGLIVIAFKLRFPARFLYLSSMLK
jgi:hypothetical protein